MFFYFIVYTITLLLLYVDYPIVVLSAFKIVGERERERQEQVTRVKNHFFAFHLHWHLW